MESINKEYLIAMRASLLMIAEEIQKTRNDLYQKISDICEELDSMLSDNEDYAWPMSIEDICYHFDFNKNTVNTHKRNHLKKGKDYFIDGTGRDRALHFEKCGALKILDHYKTEKGARYKRIHGSSILPKEEHYYINIIEYSIRRLDTPKKQFKVVIDNRDLFIYLYLQDAKVAIECDEHDHYGQEDLNKLLRREEGIVKKLGCRFLRFNPHAPDFNVGEVISVIFHIISNKLINGKDPISYYQEKRQRSIRRGSRSNINMADFV